MENVKFNLPNGETATYPNSLTQSIDIDEARVLACVCNDLSLMCELNGKENLFNTEDGRMYYHLLVDMYNHKVENFDIGGIQASLNRLGKVFSDKFIAINGNGYLNSIRKSFSPKNFESHLDMLVKSNTKLMFYKESYINLYKVYNCLSVDIDKILQDADVTLNEIKELRDVSTSKSQVLRISDDYIESKISGAKKGVSYDMGSINRMTRGLHLGNMSMLAMFVNNGKAQPLHSLIYTPNGYVKMGDIKIGDKVFDMNGDVFNVTGIFPQGKKDNYKLTFADGTSAESCEEHLWTVFKDGNLTVLELKDILKILKHSHVYIPTQKELNITNKLNIEQIISKFATGQRGHQIIVKKKNKKEVMCHLRTLGYRPIPYNIHGGCIIDFADNSPFLEIIKIEKVGIEEMQCIMVDSPTHTYLTDNMIVTHNTTINFGSVILPILESGEKVFIYSNESSIEDFQDMLLVRTLVKHFKYYKLTRTKLNELDEIKKRKPQEYREYIIKIKEAQRWIDMNYGDRIYLHSVSRYSIAEFNMLHRRYSYKGFKYFLIDTMKSEDAGDYNATGRLVQQSRDIYELARKLNTHVMVSYQIATYLKQSMKRVIDDSCLSGAKAISEILDIMITGREFYPDEYTNQKREIKVFRLERGVDGKYKKEFITLESDKKYLLIFLPKNRYGKKPKPYVYQFNGDFGTMYEVGIADNVMDR